MSSESDSSQSDLMHDSYKVPLLVGEYPGGSWGSSLA